MRCYKLNSVQTVQECDPDIRWGKPQRQPIAALQLGKKTSVFLCAFAPLREILVSAPQARAYTMRKRRVSHAKVQRRKENLNNY